MNSVLVRIAQCVSTTISENEPSKFAISLASLSQTLFFKHGDFRISRMAPKFLAGNVPADCHPLICCAVDYWQTIKPSQGLPGRQHVDPRDIPALLPYIRLIEVHGRPPRLKARLVGTMIVEFLGREYTGEWLDEVFPGFDGSATQHGYLHTIEFKQPHWKIGAPNLTHEKFYHQIERVNLPLARDGERVDMVLNLLAFHGYVRNQESLDCRA